MNISKIYRLFYVLLIFSTVLLQSCNQKDLSFENEEPQTLNDSIDFWIEASKNDTYDVNVRKQFLVMSYQKIKSAKIDTAHVRKLSHIAYRNFKLGDTLLFKRQNSEAIDIAQRIEDSLALGDLFWNYASYYNKVEVYDSAYYYFNLANTCFDKSGSLYEAAKMQYGMAFIKGRFKDYSGSEVLTFKAIDKFKKIDDDKTLDEVKRRDNTKSLFSCYNYLAQLQNDIQEYDRALFYYDKSLEYLKEIEKSEELYLASLNNIGVTHLKKGNYTKAISYFDDILKRDSLKLKSINHYARVIDNKAYCKFLMNDTISVHRYLKESLRIRDSLNYKAGIIICKIHLSKYYAFAQDTSLAISHAKEANTLARINKNGRDYLESLLLLSKLDKTSAQSYLEKHIQFSDSLQTVERRIQNKFTRIAYETDEYIEENKRLSQQKIWIIIISLGVFAISLLSYYMNRQKLVNKTLVLENEQQKANEQVYLITLKQQEKLEREKVKERNRISEELHDGILGKLFGTRVGLGFLDIKGNDDTKNQHNKFLEELQTIEKEIREVSHKLNTNFDSSQVNFRSIIYQLLESKSKIGDFKFELSFDSEIDWQKMSEIIKVNLYRIIQEALQNITKYAQAKFITVDFSIHDTDLVMIIKDDGKGFNVNRKKKGIGIKNMRTRTEKLSGNFRINSIPDQGTLIETQIPI
ncbi:sensor histidine kinase [uncultured Psychroserpens sp.]|uniref:tetratricopeptide repeat-containing sensor histidine kinase n=1 Tax=uncultured Psychroserpens sp. TaxID=255436 RepID=UPI00262384A3|nr:sensor histidine kinase [uncultured Psychroserpens sp.]